jgi:hypothetical protein
MQITPGISAFTYDVPLNQVDDMGAILYVDAKEVGCAIAPDSRATRDRLIESA